MAADPYVLNVQKWVNNKFRGKTGYTEITENGQTGWTTIYALLHGLQITLEVGSTANNFGQGTVNAFNSFVSSNGNIQERTQEQDANLREEYENATGIRKNDLGKLITQYENIHGIIQGALLCKGYSIGTNTPTGNFYGGTGAAIKILKEDVGLNNSNTIITSNIMKALLSMDYFYSYDTSEKTKNIQTIQRYLNANYELYIGLRPCDGVYGRGTNTALIYAIQAEEGLPNGTANGNFGQTTKKCCPTIPYDNVEKSYTNTVYDATKISRFTKLMKMGLYVNGFGNGNFEGTIDSTTVTNFQQKYALPTTGICNIGTWMSIFTSCGDTARSAIACDCATIINESNVNVLKANNYKYIARYLSGTIGGGISKALSKDELQTLFNNGIRLFPIHQTSANYVEYFNTSNAESDANSAKKYADQLKLQFGSIIYFAVDFDALDYQITDNIIPYFKKLYSTFMNAHGGKYRVGIYGTRNVCTRVSNAGYAVSSFVGDMSTGFSGNLGFSIPDNWALDQFTTVTINNGGKSIEIDKNGYSGQYKGISQEYDYILNGPWASTNVDNGHARILINNTENFVPVYSHKDVVYPEDGIPVYPNKRTAGDIIGYIKPHDFYVRYAVTNPSSDNVHKVMFNDGTDVKLGYITEEYYGTGDVITDPLNPDVVEIQILDGHEHFACIGYNPNTGEYVLRPWNSNGDNIFTINKAVPYFDGTGTYIGMLQKGDQLNIKGYNTGNPGQSRPWTMRVNEIKLKSIGSWQTLNGYVSTGLELGSLGNERAWF